MSEGHPTGHPTELPDRTRAGHPLPRLHLITADDILREPGFLALAHAILATHGPAVALHLRGHGLAGGELYRLATELVPVADDAGALLVVNDRVDVALAAGAHGAQLGRRSLPIGSARRVMGVGRSIGYSAHSPREVAHAADEGADFLLYGTIFPSATHPGEPTAGVEGLRDAAAIATLPLVAIGGMTPDRVAPVRAAGAHGIAVLGAVWRAERPLAAVAAFNRVIEEVSS